MVDILVKKQRLLKELGKVKIYVDTHNQQQRQRRMKIILNNI